MKLICSWLAVLATIESWPAVRVLALAPAKTPSCAAPEYHQFDFWIGDWDAFDVDKASTAVARNRVEPILGGCVLREDYRGADGSEGQSLSVYDAYRRVWHQTWVTNQGKLLVIEGEFRSGEMVLSGVDRMPDGTERRVRGTWKAEKDSVRETAMTSTDGGKSWQPWFDIVFRHRRSQI